MPRALNMLMVVIMVVAEIGAIAGLLLCAVHVVQHTHRQNLQEEFLARPTVLSVSAACTTSGVTADEALCRAAAAAALRNFDAEGGDVDVAQCSWSRDLAAKYRLAVPKRCGK